MTYPILEHDPAPVAFIEPGDVVSRRDVPQACLAVEMEAASLMAVARFMDVPLAQVLYAGDDLSGERWDSRRWQSRAEVRRGLFWLAAEAALAL